MVTRLIVSSLGGKHMAVSTTLLQHCRPPCQCLCLQHVLEEDGCKRVYGAQDLWKHVAYPTWGLLFCTQSKASVIMDLFSWTTFIFTKWSMHTECENIKQHFWACSAWYCLAPALQYAKYFILSSLTFFWLKNRGVFNSFIINIHEGEDWESRLLHPPCLHETCSLMLNRSLNTEVQQPFLIRPTQ